MMASIALLISVFVIATIRYVNVVKGVDVDGFRFSNTLGSNMVMQRNVSSMVWGWTPLNDDVVRVEFDGQVLHSTAQSKRWEVHLPVMQAGGPYVISATLDRVDSSTITLENVMFGEVWLCGGQSNMRFTVSGAFDSDEEIALSAMYSKGIRLFTVGTNTISKVPLDELKTVDYPWAEASPALLEGPEWLSFSATCWFFGRALFRKFNGQVPIGLISSNWGGTPIQSWSSKDALASCKQPSRSDDKRRAANWQISLLTSGGPHAFTPRSDVRYKYDYQKSSVLYNAMIAPFLHMSIAGVVWYQGEQNLGDPSYYSCQFPAMITDWRNKFAGQRDFPFIFVQLSTWLIGNTAIAELREAQLSAMKLKNVNFAVAADLGDLASPLGCIHPRRKQAVGYRLALAAYGTAYPILAVPKMKYMNPAIINASIITQPGLTDVLSIKVNTWDSKLIKRPVVRTPGVPTKQCRGFELRVDNKWISIGAFTMTRDTIIITLKDNQRLVTAVRYGWSSWPIMSLYSLDGLPLVPFLYELSNIR